MKTKFYFIILFTALSCLNVFGQEAFIISEDFDNPEHFNADQFCPDQWKSEGTYPLIRGLSTDYGLPPYSGSYILATTPSTLNTRDEVIYTPMMSLAQGTECKISFYYLAPGGTPAFVKNTGLMIKAGTDQTLATQTIEIKKIEGAEYKDWTKIEATFIPEKNENYCFSISLTTQLSQSGMVAFDDFSITGFSPKKEEDSFTPDSANVAIALKVPYTESFDNENDNYDGTTYVPAKWLSTGTIPFTTLSNTLLKARTGDYYLYTDYSETKRDECVYTPFFNLKAGQEYAINCYVHLDAENLTPNTNYTNSLHISVATQQDDSHKQVLLELNNYSNTEPWELQTVKFTPAISGAYCFAYNLYSDGPFSGFVALEDFSITLSGVDPAPEAKFGVNQLYNITTGEMQLYEKQDVQIINLSKYAKTYKWSVNDTENAIFSNDTISDPVVSFKKSGSYTIKLTTGNDTGEDESFKELNILIADNNQKNLGITPTSPFDTPLMKGSVPHYKTSELDFITGPNHYYKTVAERVEVPENINFKINTMNLVLTNLRYKSRNTGKNQSDGKVEVVFYGEKDGLPDETNEYGRYTSTFKELFGENGIGSIYGDPCDIIFPEGITVEGNFYITFIYDSDFDIEVEDVNIGRSFVGLAALEHESSVTTLYAKPSNVPTDSKATVDKWCKIDELDSKAAGYGLWYVLWIDSNDKTKDGIAINPLGEIVFDVLVSDDSILVSGTEAGETVVLYDINGKNICSIRANNHSVRIPRYQTDHGVYIVQTKKGSKKIVL